jgi:hypothetical protein
MWKIHLKDKYIHKNKHDNIHKYIQNVFVIVELLSGTWGPPPREGQGKGKDNDRVNNIAIHCICAGRGHDDIY